MFGGLLFIYFVAVTNTPKKSKGEGVYLSSQFEDANYHGGEGHGGGSDCL